MMRLLFVHDNRFEHGADGHIYTSGTFPSALWERYLRHFDEVCVLARNGRNKGAAGAEIRADRARVFFQFAPNIGSLWGAAFNWRTSRARVRAAVAQANAVVARLPSELGFLAAAEAERQGKPLAVELAGCAWDAAINHGSPILKLYAPIFFHRTCRAAARAPLVVYVTSEFLQNRYPSSHHQISCSDVEIVPLSAEDRGRRGRRLERLARGGLPQLGTIASLSPFYKGLHLAIEAIAQLRAEGLHYPYAILGPGNPEPWRALARSAGVEDLVRFDGTREPGAPVRGWLDDIDLHLQPSLAEGLPRATIEAMSRGVACIGSDVGGIPELLPRAQLHPSGDSRSLAETIRRLATAPDLVASAAWSGVEQARLFWPEMLERCHDEAYGRLRAMAEARSGGCGR
ncbi:glycosyltransferase [Sphingosinicella sp. BN140058]|uniref:glycosyltransferase n=1 Tax=Sphingosinicella sp. BN140058 TaxID=1892855 RepID=UPI0010110059|nr:glycosyltransferase [Sphingosinicella sp. BN140058]QAY78466.1 glycosyltransferase [Sphingosinicella sp. BN140058]